jgi:hypothetical protein
MPRAVTRIEDLACKVDAFFARVAQRHGAEMQCATGCSDCCHVRLTITRVEAEAIRAHVTTWPTAERRNLADTGPSDRCAALDAAGRCRIYAARPLVCRSHGVPIRMRRDGRPGLPVIPGLPGLPVVPGLPGLPDVDACHRNFRHVRPDPDCILDQATLSATLLAVDAAEAAEASEAGASAGAGERVDLAGLLADLAAF